MLGTRLSMLALLCIASCTLSGARQGIVSLLWPDLSKAYSAKTWISASRHMFYSVGLALGMVTFFASYNKFDWPVLGTAVKICVTDTVYGLLAGFFVFALIGHVADAFDEDIADVANSAPRGLEYLFVTFPETIETLPYTRFWALAFYVLTATSALGPQLCAFGGVVGSLADLNPALRESPVVWAFTTCTAAFALSLPLTLRGIGIQIREFVTAVVYGDLLPWIGFTEVIIVMHAYGSSRFVDDIYFTLDEYPPTFLLFCWRFVCPSFLLIIGLTSLLGRVNTSTDGMVFPEWANMIEMAVFGTVVIVVGAFVLLTLAENRYDLYSAMEPHSGFGPKEPEVYRRYLTFLASRNAVPTKKSRHRPEQSYAETPLSIASLRRQAGESIADKVASTPPCNPPEVEMRGQDGVTAWPAPDVLDDQATRYSATEEDELHSALPVTFATSTGADSSTAATFRDKKDSASSSNEEKHVK